MDPQIWIKVVGFTDVERHSLNTLFRLSVGLQPSYALWMPEQSQQPNIALIDVDSYEGQMELASPNLNPNLKLICVGERPPANAWRTLIRPVDWTELVQELDALFPAQADDALDFDLDGDAGRTELPGIKLVLLVGLQGEDAMYMRARLSLAGMTDVDEANTGGEASAQFAKRQYEVVFVSLELADVDGWVLAQTLKDLPVAPHSIVLMTQSPSWASIERAEKMGCAQVLDIPFNPRQVIDLLQKV